MFQEVLLLHNWVVLSLNFCKRVSCVVISNSVEAKIFAKSGNVLIFLLFQCKIHMHHK